MPKLLRIVMVLIIIIFAAGCARPAASGPSRPAGEGITIATSFYPLYIMALNVAMDIPDVTVVNMTPPTTGCLHDYSATPDDMKNLERADFLIVNGAGMESFLGKIIELMPNLRIIEASKGIPLIEGDGESGGNPHVWVSVSNCIVQVRNIETQLSALDAAHASSYKANADAYVQKLEDLKGRMHKALDNVENRNIITFHEAFPYFAQEFNLNIAGVIEREPGSEPSARELAQAIDQINALKIRALFAEPQYPATAANTIARETGAKVYILDPAVIGPDDPGSYISIMESNMRVLQEALR